MKNLVGRHASLSAGLLMLLASMAWGQPTSFSEDTASDFFARYCTKCHGAETQKADIAVHQPFPDALDEEMGQHWELVLEMLDSEAMPPEDELQPATTDRAAIVQWLKQQLQKSVLRDESSASATSIRRLSNFEYQNTLQDLLGIQLNVTDLLPEDPFQPYRFNNTAEFLLMGGERLDRYEEIAKLAMAAAIVDPNPPEVHTSRKEWKSDQGRNQLAVDGNKRGSPADGLGIKSWPTHGEYRIKIKASGLFPDGCDDLPLRLVMGYELAGDIGAAPFAPVGTIHLSRDDSEPRVYEFRGRIENHPWQPERKYRRGGTRTGKLTTIPAKMAITPQNLYDDGTLNDGLDPTTRPQAVIDWIEFEAPIVEPWPPEHHTSILFESPLRADDPDAYIRAVLQRFLPRAFRRTLLPGELERYERIYQIYSVDETSLEEAMRATLVVALTSPSFLFHLPATSESLQQYALANRMSYFLWGSMPDEELLALAEQRKLHDPQVVEVQTRRMLADPRSQDFFRSFATQWLGLEKCKSVPINAKLYPRFLHRIARGQHQGDEVPFRPTIRDDMVDETIQFFGELVRRNANLLNIVDSEFAMLNERLANHYGVADVQGHQFRVVPLTPETRLGGILTHGSILVGTGTGSAPHPIYRAVWLREAILGDEVKPPPADVPALEETAGESAESAANIKDLLRLHRQKVSCNDCHARLDPWGIPFEKYSAIGRFQPKVPEQGAKVRGFEAKRDQDLNGYARYLDKMYIVDVDSASKLPNGPEVDGLDDLKHYLITERADDVADNLVRRFLSYALGRRLNYRDHVTVERLRQDAAANGYKLQDLLVSICQSELFMGHQD